MKIEKILYPKVLVKDLSTGVMTMKHADDFTGPLHEGAMLEFKGGKYCCIGFVVDEDCINGVCPIK